MSRVYLATRYLPFVVLALAVVFGHGHFAHPFADPLLP